MIGMNRRTDARMKAASRKAGKALRAKRWREENKEYVRKMKSDWYSENREDILARRKQKRAAKKLLTGK